MIKQIIEKFSDLPRANRWLAYFENSAVPNLNETLYFCQSADIPGRSMMTKETFGLTQPASYAYGTTLGDLSMQFLVSAGTDGTNSGPKKTSTYETFFAWMDSIVSMGQANISYADEHVSDIRLKLIDQAAFTHGYWKSGGGGIAKGAGEHVSLLATRAWPSAIGNLSFTMEEGIMQFSVTFKIHKLLEHNTDIAGNSLNQTLSRIGTEIAKYKSPSAEIQKALEQANETGRAAVGAFDKISQAIVKDGQHNTVKNP